MRIQRGIDLSPYGAWTLKSLQNQGGLEPDECYLVGDQGKPTPDLAIEVVWTSGGIDKLEIYRRLGIGEVWFWKASRIEVHVLRQDRLRAFRPQQPLPGPRPGAPLLVPRPPGALRAPAFNARAARRGGRAARSGGEVATKPGVASSAVASL
jgi:hypothetical protein